MARVVLREVIGALLREHRRAQGRCLREVSQQACISLGYLSEIERGRKDPSSEMLSVICEALELTLPDLLQQAAHRITTSHMPEHALVPSPPVDMRGTPAQEAGSMVLSRAS